jgi:hypothetical protein
LLVHISASSPIFKRAVSKLHMDSNTQAVKTELGTGFAAHIPVAP